ncbi:hypothetical protein ACRAWF_45725 [Streptomyces sp. L7]
MSSEPRKHGFGHDGGPRPSGRFHRLRGCDHRRRQRPGRGAASRARPRPSLRTGAGLSARRQIHHRQRTDPDRHGGDRGGRRAGRHGGRRRRRHPTGPAPGRGRAVEYDPRPRRTRGCGVVPSARGAFVLAELGLLSTAVRPRPHWRQAATHWPAATPECASGQPDAIHVRGGRFVTSAGISAGIDLALALVEDDHGAAVARDVARELVVFMQRPGGQSQFSAATTTASPPTDPLRSLIASVLADPAADHSLPAMAATAASQHPGT